MPRNRPIPLAATMPRAESIAPAAGTGAAAAREDHTHPVLRSSTMNQTTADGRGTVVFTRSFDAEPCMVYAPREATDNGGLTWKTESFTVDGNGKYVGAVVRFYRIQALPNPLGLLTALVGFRVDSGAVGVIPFSCIAVAQTTT